MFTRSRTLLQQQLSEKREQERAARAIPARTLHRGNYGGTTSGPAPKSESHRDLTLLQMAHGRPCLLLVPGVCNHRQDTTVACHENQSKGMAIKASDERSAWGCFACHIWYDTGRAPRTLKRETFMAAHLRQVLAWRVIATDPAEPERYRAAAKRALERLNATPLPEEMM